MKRLRRALVLLVLVVVPVPLFVGPYVYYAGRGEHFYRLRPTSYWSREVARHRNEPGWSPPLPDRLAEVVGIGRLGSTSAPAVLLGHPDSVPVLLDLLRDKDEDVREDAASILSGLHPEARGVREAMVWMLADGNVHVRHEAIVYWEERRSDLIGSLPALRHLLSEVRGVERGNVLQALALVTEGTLGPLAPLAPELIQSLEDECVTARVFAAWLLLGMDLAPDVGLAAESVLYKDRESLSRFFIP